ncbi:MAG: hypothetical protein A2202_06270 [Bdellovibrionales bacterium RIFOXYA1_FULL_36_14]|nr:MAG: hypothetical protein A2202_06270 [Bdellovibrionales bacterium RIFOXYA1_FULL_36_14]
MGRWKWEGTDKAGKKMSGSMQARSEREVRKVLRAKSIRTRKVIPPSILEFDLTEWMVDKGLAKSFGTFELCSFTKQLAIMIDAGVPILQCFEILYKSEKNMVLKKTIQDIAISVGEGKTIADSMEKQSGFNKLYCSLVRAGEVGGILDQILRKLAEHMDRQQKIRSQIKSAMTYPAIVVLIGFLVIYGMMVFVVPKFLEMLQDSKQEVPFVTQMVVDISNFFQSFALHIVGVLIFAFVLLKSYIKTPGGKVVYDKLTMNVPIFGGIIIKGNLASLTRTLSTMLSAGVALVDALNICIDTIDNKVIAQDIVVVRKAVIEGKTLTEPLSKIEYFPDMVAQMIKVGEQTGNLDQMLLKIADVFEEQVNVLVNNMTKLIEPIIIVVLGGIVAVIMIAMYLPIFMQAGGDD